MDKRTAKIEAYRRASGVLETAMDGADGDWLGDKYGDDAPKVEAALMDVVAELRRKGGLE